MQYAAKGGVVREQGASAVKNTPRAQGTSKEGKNTRGKEAPVEFSKTRK